MQSCSSVTHPQTNGWAKASNKVFRESLKGRLKDSNGKWVQELSSVLWAFRTTICQSTGETPFSLTYGIEAIISLVIGLATLRAI